ncbi:ABC transporter substrate-binding protein [Trueperella pecoris]|uniref:Sugar ABC transporter substrate-binding protein n=1 Tax=Trueperella pecoris TaxID=2733571 RepID=A0A7M1QVJ7_9ACTO|nr:sugar ABC transporter substrate-binding protein [Trueperella pecoris]QOR45968.1 sugar ABC transporter substrate-binding protein [Trueperella pecoris]QTG75795.1 sugar ABC transporter substrate-binding protein [Trueperella pecoris]
MKKRNLKKTAAVALGAALVVGMLSACSGGSNEARGKGSVTWSTWGTPDELKVFEKFNAEFEARHPDIKINFQPVASYSDYHSKLNTQLTSGTAPDVFYVGDDQIANLVANGVLEPIDSHVESAASPISLADFSEAIYQVAQLDGQTYGLPNDVNPDAFWYDKQALAAAGIAEDPADLAAKDEWTTDKFFEMADALHRADMTGAAFWNYWSTTDSMIASQGGKIYDDAGKYVANTDATSVAALEKWAQKFADGHFAVADVMPAGQDPDTLFAQHKLGFLVQGRYTVASVEGAGNSIDDYDVVRWPTPDGKATTSGVASSFLAINKKAADKEAAFTFFSEFLSKEGQTLRLSGNGNALPSITGIDEIVTSVHKPTHVATLLGMRDKGFSNFQVEAAVPGLSAQISNDHMLPLYQGKSSAQKTLDQIAELVSQKTSK